MIRYQRFNACRVCFNSCNRTTVNNRFGFTDQRSNCVPCCSSRPLRALRTVLIMRSQTPPAWLAFGGFNLNSNQSYSFFSRNLRTSSQFIFFKDSCSPLAPTRLVPWSDLSCRTGPHLAKKQRKTFINESVSSVFATSKCIAQDARQVKRTSLICQGPK